ncbi:Leucine-rich repeat (LRR) protein [Bradyrhizobium sp. USDA 4532]|uniref:NEL-type E3 ubiquitin ligase domain-containing protein n=1 Tax=unclassified Bradyrhizobium TaxID=2631580 RepID=UPI0020A216CE|nr:MULTISPECIES: NEL-type E3 ubiquitin ligase domain-containing protein [unclassified Bradyrhizobium]MCP1835317.1 Leucine-rich repeat (LRR) protein [Bradyrhizobium sp. USDA 4545]MCP1920063.1 Leucine-rich repeat (LRR) protein [Bradyrhizobium sp. USDA 4532]
MVPFEAGQIQHDGGPPSASAEQEGRQNEAAAQWQVLVTGYAAAASDHAQANEDQTLENWAAEPEVGPLEDREEVVRRVNARGDADRLNLESLSLTGLPRFPDDIVVLDIPFNRLTSLPDNLPASLRRLNVSANQLTSLPALPTELRGLDARSNRLRSSPEGLPAALEFLDLSHNQLLDLPEVLPVSLRFLYASQNQLTNLPEVLPATLEYLDVSENQLTRLPEVLPASLEFLDASQNRLTSLPEDLLTQIGADGGIILTENPLPEQVLANLDTVLSANGYVGPTVYLSRDDESESSGTDDEPADALIEKVADWLRGNPQEADREVLAAWQSLAEEPGAREYTLFLGKLFDSVNSRNEEFRQSVADDLRQAAKDPQLCKRYFQLALDANQSCEDRRTLTWNGMQTARLIADVENGAYNNKARLPDLIDLGRVMFRLDALERIAREKVHSLGSGNNVEDIDAIEVSLAYQNKLRERLGLQHVAPNMRFFEVSGVTNADVDSAEASVREREATEFADYLAVDWQPWDDVVSHIAPKDHAMAHDELIAAMGPEFARRLQQQLTDRGLIGVEADLVEDAKLELGAAVRREIAREIKGALRDKVLNDHCLKL